MSDTLRLDSYNVGEGYQRCFQSTLVVKIRAIMISSSPLTRLRTCSIGRLYIRRERIIFHSASRNIPTV